MQNRASQERQGLGGRLSRTPRNPFRRHIAALVAWLIPAWLVSARGDRESTELATTKPQSRDDFVTAVNEALGDLDAVSTSSEAEIESITRAFHNLAEDADGMLKEAAAIVSSVEDKGMGTGLSRVQSLSVTVTTFLDKRLEAATTVLATLEHEQSLLTRLALVTHRQEAIGHHLKALSVLTNVEVSHLGDAGNDFQILAQELSEFSNTVSHQTVELASHTDSRKQALEQTRREMATDVPRLRYEMSHMQSEVRQSLEVIDAGLTQLARVPEQFRATVEETAQQIAGVVAAIQAHDITRQQVEHVQSALQAIAPAIAASVNGDDEALATAYAGTRIQIGQLRTIKDTIAAWMSQVEKCMGGIRQLSASEVTNIGPAVLDQEQNLSAHLTKIELLQQKSQEFGGRIRHTLRGLSSLLDLVNEHLTRSQAIRQRLELLMFNSLIEANRLGDRGAVVSAIANLIKVVSAEWNNITDQSRCALTDILKLVNQTDKVMEVFSEASCQTLREDQAQTRAALDQVRSAAADVAQKAARMQLVTQRMQANLVRVGSAGDHLDKYFGHLETARTQLEELVPRMEIADPQVSSRYDPTEVERLFGGSYTTEIERDVMRSVLRGTPMPAAQQSFAGNSVELF